MREDASFVLLPVPVGGEFGKAPKPRLARAQLGGAFAHRALEQLVVVLEFFVEQPHFQHVVNAGLDFEQLEGFADEIFRAGLQCTQLVCGLRGEHDDGQVAVGDVFFQLLHHLEAVDAGHLQVEQDQVEAVLSVQRLHILRLHRGRHVGVARFTEHALQQPDVGLLVVDDQQAGVQDVIGAEHHVASSVVAPATSVSENFNARSIVAMNSSTLIGFVR